MKSEVLRARLKTIPRIPLAAYPTPLEPLDRLARRLGPGTPRLWIKRDDGIGPAMGGNKARKLEYLLAEARARGARRVSTFGGLQSNHARMTAAAAISLGMEPHLFFFEPAPARRPGNLLLNDLLGARVHFLPLGAGGGMSLEAACRLVRLVSLLLAGPGAYFIPVGGHNRTGCLGYVAAAAEIHDQAEESGLRAPLVILAAGSGGTLAGLWAGLTLLSSPVSCLGIDVGKLWRGFPSSVAKMGRDLCSYMGEPAAMANVARPVLQRLPLVDDLAVPLIEGDYAGPGYACCSPACLSAIRLLAETEGILLDPVYTGKAFAGLLDLLARGELAGFRDVVFLHTGGLPGLFAFPEAAAVARGNGSSP